jgi:hypothetical protein
MNFLKLFVVEQLGFEGLFGSITLDFRTENSDLDPFPKEFLIRNADLTTRRVGKILAGDRSEGALQGTRPA